MWLYTRVWAGLGVTLMLSLYPIPTHSTLLILLSSIHSSRSHTHTIAVYFSILDHSTWFRFVVRLRKCSKNGSNGQKFKKFYSAKNECNPKFECFALYALIYWGFLFGFLCLSVSLPHFRWSVCLPFRIHCFSLFVAFRCIVLCVAHKRC